MTRLNATAVDAEFMDGGTPYSVPVNQWVHLAFVADGNDTKLYADGQYKGSVALNESFPMNSIGSTHRSGCGKAAFLMGKMDEVVVFKKVLDPYEIAALVSQADPYVAYWKMDENTDDT